MYEQALIDAGFSAHQAAVYSFLIKNGPRQASAIARAVHITRTLVYRILDELIKLGLVEKADKKGEVSKFIPAHPIKLKEITEKRKEEADRAGVIIESVVHKLSSEYNLVSGKPGVRFFEGLEGLKSIYNDILKEGKDFYLIRSNFEPVYREQMLPVISAFVQKRIQKNMHVIALTPKDEVYAAGETVEQDKKNLLTRTWVNAKDYSAAVEIDIYGDKVALLSFGNELMGTIIESPQITQALKEIFILAQKKSTLP